MTTARSPHPHLSPRSDPGNGAHDCGRQAAGTAIAIFAKAPIEGFAKTRLIPRLGAQAAADLQRRMIERTVRTALAADIGPVSLWCAPDCGHELFSSLASAHMIDLHPQSGSDLGARMLNAFEVLAPGSPVMIIGVDCLVLQASHLRQCATLLDRSYDAVFIPTEDGGYALVAATAQWPELFTAVPWGTSAVMAETRLRASRIGLRVSEPAILWDVDTPEDHDRAAKMGLC